MCDWTDLFLKDNHVYLGARDAHDFANMFFIDRDNNDGSHIKSMVCKVVLRDEPPA